MAKIKVTLTTDGGFKGLEDLDYTTVFDAEEYIGFKEVVLGVDILIADLIAAGASKDVTTLNEEYLEPDTMYFGNANGVHGQEYLTVVK